MAKKLTDDYLRWTLDVDGKPAAKALGELEVKTYNLTAANKSLATEMEKMKAKGKDNTEEYAQLEAQFKKNNDTISQTKTQMAGLRDELGVSEMTAKQLRASMKDLKGQMDGLTPKTEKWNELNAKFQETKARLNEINGVVPKTNAVFGALKELLPAIGIGAVIGAATGLVSKIISVRGEFEKYEAVLTNTYQSHDKAVAKMTELQNLAIELPVSLREVTESFIKLKNRGMDPTHDQMVSLSDLAMSQGKSLDQFVEALLDAQTGEFERLKEFGVTAKQHGDKVSMTFKGVTTEVKKNDEALKNYVLSLGKLPGVAGSSAAVMNTLQGKISNLGDSMDRMFNKLGEGAIGNLVKSGISVVGRAVDNITKMFSAAEISTLEQTNQKVAENNVAIQTSFSLAKDATLSKNAHAEAIKRINEQYGQYLPHMLTEKSTLGEIEAAEKAVTKAIISQAIAKGYKDEITKATQKQIEAAKGVVNAEVSAKEAHIKGIAETNDADAKRLAMNEKMASVGKQISKNTLDNADKEKNKIKSTYQAIGDIFSITWSEIEKASNALDNPDKGKGKKNTETDAQRKAAMEKELKEEEDAYNKHRATIKQEYLDGKIKDQDDYTKKLEDLETPHFEKQLAITKKHHGEVGELENKFMDSKLKDKETNLKRELEVEKSSYNDKLANIEKDFNEGRIQTQSEYNVAKEEALISDLNKQKDILTQFGQDTAAIEKQIEAAKLSLKKEQYAVIEEAINAENQKQENNLTQEYDNGLKTQEQFNKEKIKNELAYLTLILAARKKYGQNTIDVENKINKTTTAIQDKDTQKQKKDFATLQKDYEKKINLAEDFGKQVGEATGEAIANGDDVLKAAGKATLIAALSELKKYAELQIARVTIGSMASADSIASFGVAGIAKAAILTGLIEAAFAAVKGIVSQAADGRYDVVGADDGITYNNVPFIGQAQTGMYSKPVLISEQGGEMVIDNPTVRRIMQNEPHVINRIMANRVNQHASGSYPANTQYQALGNQQNNDAMMQILAANTTIMQALHARLQKPITADVSLLGKAGFIAKQAELTAIQNDVNL